MNSDPKKRLMSLKLQSVQLAGQTQMVLSMAGLLQEHLALNRELLKFCHEITEPNPEPVPVEAPSSPSANRGDSSGAGGAGSKANGGANVAGGAGDVPRDIPE